MIRLYPCPPFPVRPLLRLLGSIGIGVVVYRFTLVGLAYSMQPADMSLPQTIEALEPEFRPLAISVAFAYLLARYMFARHGTLREGVYAVTDWLCLLLTNRSFDDYSKQANDWFIRRPWPMLVLMLCVVAGLAMIVFFAEPTPPPSGIFVEPPQ